VKNTQQCVKQSLEACYVHQRCCHTDKIRRVIIYRLLCIHPNARRFFSEEPKPPFYASGIQGPPNLTSSSLPPCLRAPTGFCEVGSAAAGSGLPAPAQRSHSPPTPTGGSPDGGELWITLSAPLAQRPRARGCLSRTHLGIYISISIFNAEFIKSEKQKCLPFFFNTVDVTG